MNTIFSSTYSDVQIKSETEDILLDNISESDDFSDSDISKSANNPRLESILFVNADGPAPSCSTPLPMIKCEDNSSSENENSENPAISQHNISGKPRHQSQTKHTPVWADVTEHDSGPLIRIPISNAKAGPILPSFFDEKTASIEYFELFFNEDLITHLQDETNLFAESRKSQNQSPKCRINRWKPVSCVDMKAFLGVILNMGLTPLPDVTMYYSNKWEDKIQFYGDVFAKNDFLNIFWNLHFNHDMENKHARPKDFLISPILEHIKKYCKLFYTTTDNVSVDESTISSNGKVTFRVYNPNKLVKFGMKFFVVSDCKNGYIFDFLPYFRKDELFQNPTLLKATQRVKVLCQSVIMKDQMDPRTGLHVYTGRYYTSPELANELLEMNCYLTGTVMTNQANMPPNIKYQSQKMRIGEIMAKRNNNTLVLSWRDKRVIHMLSTKHKGDSSEMVNVASRWPNKPSIKKPNVVLDYIKHMGAVDRNDNFIASYQFMRKTKKWYKKMFFWLLEVAVVNSYILYKEVQLRNNTKPLTQRQFRKSLIRELVSGKMAENITKRKGKHLRQAPTEERLHGHHFIEKRAKYFRCVVCTKKGLRRETNYACKICTSKPALHPDTCYEEYHCKETYDF